ncbi:MAG: dolichyl-phosphate beta-glucosyltransferase [Patescibacteria group bacterium]
MPSISIIIPAYNEAKRLPQTLQHIHSYCQRLNRSIEVIVVDDGSTDQTVQKVEQLHMAEVRVLRQSHNAGKFAAFRTGVEAAKHDWVLLYDADGATPIAVLDSVLPELTGNYDGFIGSRRIARANITIEQSIWRKWFGLLAYKIIRLVTGVTFQDTQCGFKLCRTALARQAVSKMQVTRFAGDVELIYLLQYFGGRLKEIPVEWHDVPDSTVRLSDYWKSLKDVLQIRRNINRGVYQN